MEPDLDGEAKHGMRSFDAVPMSVYRSLNTCVYFLFFDVERAGEQHCCERPGKDALAALEDYKASLRTTQTLLNDMSVSVSKLSLGVLDVHQRISDIESRIDTQNDALKASIQSAMDHGRSWEDWLPNIVALITIMTSLSAMILAWRKDFREALGARKKKDPPPPKQTPPPTAGAPTAA